MNQDFLKSLLESGDESPQLDYKESCNWDAVSFAKDILAMSNVQDGGYIVIGVTQLENGSFQRAGISPENKESYNIDKMKDDMSAYADPYVDFSLEFIIDDNALEFAVISVKPFEEIPVICKRDAAGLCAGRIYYRNRNRRVESAPVSTSSGLRDILERSSAKLHIRAVELGYYSISSNSSQINNSNVEMLLKEERGDL